MKQIDFRKNYRNLIILSMTLLICLLLSSCNGLPADSGFVSFVSIDSARYHTRNYPSWEMSETPDGRMYHIGRFWKSYNLFATELTLFSRSTMEQENTYILETYPFQSEYFAPLSTIMLDSETVYMLRYDSATRSIIEDRFTGIDLTDPSVLPVKTSQSIYSYTDTYYNFKAQYYRDSSGQPTLAVKIFNGTQRELELYKLDSRGEWTLFETLDEGRWDRMIFYVEPSGRTLLAGDYGVYVKSFGGNWIYHSDIDGIVQFTNHSNDLLATDQEGNIFQVDGTNFILVKELNYENGMIFFHEDGSMVLLQTSPYYLPRRSVTSEFPVRTTIVIVPGTPTQHQHTEALMISAEGIRQKQEIYRNSFVSDTEPIQFKFSMIIDSYGHPVIPLYGQYTSSSINWKEVVVDWE